MASEKEIHEVMTYIAADTDYAISAARRKVWYDQFKEEDPALLMAAARVIVGKKSFGKFPQVSLMREVLYELQNPSDETWADAWDKWIRISKRHGFYEKALALEKYEAESPRGKQALGSMVDEWHTMKQEDLPIYRAQFKARYEAQAKRHREAQAVPRDMLPNGPVLKLLEAANKKAS